MKTTLTTVSAALFAATVLSVPAVAGESVLKGAEPGVLEARLLLADCVRRVIALSLGIVGVSAPEKM